MDNWLTVSDCWNSTNQLRGVSWRVHMCGKLNKIKNSPVASELVKLQLEDPSL